MGEGPQYSYGGRAAFLALVLFHELKRRLTSRAWDLEWNDIRHDLQSLTEVKVREGENIYLLRTALEEATGKVLQAAGVATPPSVRPAE